MPQNVFAHLTDTIYPFKFAGRIEVERLMGGTPSDQNVAEGWLRTKLGEATEDQIAQMVAETMASRNVTETEALAEVGKLKHLNGFKSERCDDCPTDPREPLCAAGEHPLYIEGRHLKAALKEAASVARSVENLDTRYGSTNKGTLSFVAEHIIVVETVLVIGKQDANGKIRNVYKPDGIIQSFPKNPRTNQTGIQNTEYVDNAVIDFTVISDYEWKPEEWGAIWLTGGNQGIGASRSQGYGRYNITRWDMIGTGIKKPLVGRKTTAKKSADEPTDA